MLSLLLKCPWYSVLPSLSFPAFLKIFPCTVYSTTQWYHSWEWVSFSVSPWNSMAMSWDLPPSKTYSSKNVSQTTILPRLKPSYEVKWNEIYLQPKRLTWPHTYCLSPHLCLSSLTALEFLLFLELPRCCPVQSSVHLFTLFICSSSKIIH